MFDLNSSIHQTASPLAKPDVVYKKTLRRKAARVVVALITAFSLAGSGLILSACNTTAGVGQDVSATGHALTGAAQRAK